MTALRRLRLPHPLLVVTIVAAVAGWMAVTHLQRAEAAGVPAAQAAAGQGDAELLEEGRVLYRLQCSSCHGLRGNGVQAPNGAVRGPSLENSGAAAAYYYLATGRMPLANSEEIPNRKDSPFTERQIAALVAYVASLGEGQPIPDVDLEEGDIAEGGELFRLNCAACHSATGAGGALSYGRSAPPLGESDPLVVASAVRVGPGQMPRFGRNTLTEEELNSINSYVQYLREPDDRGGVALGRLGPIPEGMAAWMIGLGLLLIVSYLIGKRAREPETS